MSAAVELHPLRQGAHVLSRVPAWQREPARIALLGTGTVGRAVLERLASWTGTALDGRIRLVHVANSRAEVGDAAGLCPRTALQAVDAGRTAWRETTVRQARFEFADSGSRIVIDATASEAVAARHASWLERGIHVVSASKLGLGTSLARWRSIRGACESSRAQYGDSATVGAGLPVLRSLRELQDGGDRIQAVAGVLSGSLAWLFHHYDGMRPFSALVRQACEAGYTEPDPRDDLSGEDVRRKTVILARAMGISIEPNDVDVASLVPPDLATLARGELDQALPALDAPLRARFAQAHKLGEKLRFIARLECTGDGAGKARVGLESLPLDHPLAGGSGTDNRVAIWSDRYATQPLVIQGPGAGAGVTAAALLDDALRIAAHR